MSIFCFYISNFASKYTHTSRSTQYSKPFIFSVLSTRNISFQIKVLGQIFLWSSSRPYQSSANSWKRYMDTLLSRRRELLYKTWCGINQTCAVHMRFSLAPLLFLSFCRHPHRLFWGRVRKPTWEWTNILQTLSNMQGVAVWYVMKHVRIKMHPNQTFLIFHPELGMQSQTITNQVKPPRQADHTFSNKSRYSLFFIAVYNIYSRVCTLMTMTVQCNWCRYYEDIREVMFCIVCMQNKAVPLMHELTDPAGQVPSVNRRWLFSVTCND